MKRIIALLLVCVLVLSLCACGKSEAVKNVEALIDALGEITPERANAVQEAQNAYDALPEEEKAKVGNYETLCNALDRSCEFGLIGNWCNTFLDAWNVEGMYQRVDFSLYEDMTFYIDYSEFQTGTWQVDQQKLLLQFDENNIMVFTISKDGDTYTLANGENTYLPQDAFHALLDDMFMVVELTAENVADYCEPYIYTKEELDATGTATGFSKTYAMIGNKVYGDGWCCFNGKDIAIEMQIPEQIVTHSFQNGEGSETTKAAHTATVTFEIPFAAAAEEVGYVSIRGTYASNLTAEQITFSQASGKLYFINLSYISDFPYVDKNNRNIALTDGSTIPNCAWNQDLWNEEHPY